MKADRKQKIQAIFQSVKDLTPEQKDKLLASLEIKNPEGHALSGRNCLLLDRQAAMFNPNISFSVVGGFKQWQKHNRVVKKGESGFYIAIPSKKETDNPEQTDLNDLFFFFRSVFDISQTEVIKAK